MSNIRVGRWNCKTCGHTGNLGPEIHCESCGAPRSKDVEFYLPDDAEIVTDATKINAALSGTDWSCSHCGAANRATETSCHACGNPNGDAQDVVLKEIEYSLENTPKSGKDFKKPPLPPPLPHTSGKKNPVLRWIGMGAVAIAGLFTLLMFYGWLIDIGGDIPFARGFQPLRDSDTTAVRFGQLVNSLTVDATIEITGFGWERRIQMEKLVEVPYKGDYVPPGSRLVSQRQVIDHYNKVPNGTVTKTRQVRVKTGSRRYKCGTINKGNGYFQDKMCEEAVYGNKSETYQETVYRDEPVYKTEYSYTTPEWHAGERAVSQGNDRQPHWPQVSTNARLREASRSEVLKISYLWQGTEIRDSVNTAFWNQHTQTGEKVKVRQRLLESQPISLYQQ